MAQQQLFLLVLGIVIVGLATVVGLQAFDAKQKQANSDALLVTAIRIASDAQAWLRKPQSFGGGRPPTGGVPADFSGVTVDLTDLSYPVNASDEYSTVEGLFTIDNSGGEITIEGKSAGSYNNVVCVTVAGPLQTDISTEIKNATDC